MTRKPAGSFVGRAREKLGRRLAGTPLELPVGITLNADLVRGSTGRVGYIGWIGRGNLGDELLLEVFRRRLPEIDFRHLSSGLTPRLLRTLKRLNLGKVFSANLIGGGTIIGQKSFRRVVESLVEIFPETPLSAIGVGVEDQTQLHNPRNAGDLPKWLNLLKRFESISVRGPLSQARLAEIGISASIVGDTALALARYRPRVQVRPLLLGLNISRTPYPNSRSIDPAPILIDFALQLARDGWGIRLFVFNSSDNQILSPGTKGLGGHRGVEVVTPDVGMDRLLALVAECHVFVGHRLHSSVLATAMGVPAVILEYLPKCRDFPASIGREEFGIPMPELNKQKLLSMTEFLADNRDAQASEIEAAVSKRLNDLESQFDAFRALITRDPEHG